MASEKQFLPDGQGWEELSLEADGWVKWDEGVLIQGFVKQHLKTKKGRDAYIIQLSKPTYAIPRDSADGAESLFEAGETIGITATAALRGLIDCKNCEVHIHCVEQTEFDGNPMWKMKLRRRGNPQRFAVAAAPVDAPQSGGDDDIPF